MVHPPDRTDPRSPPSRSRRAFLTALSLAIAGMLGCGVEGNPDRASTVTVLYEADERLFGPVMPGESWFLMFLPLAEHDETGRLVGRLARSWEHSPDYRDWVLHLRSGVRWHDGQPVTADDVRFSIELMAHPDVRFETVWHDLDSVRVHDDTTLSLHYGRPRSNFLAWTVYWPRHHLEGRNPSTFYEWAFWTQPVGNGPYRYVRHVPRTMVELSANADFYAGKPAIDRVRIKFGSELSLVELLSGNVDIVTRVNTADLATLQGDGRFEIYRHVWPNIPWLLTIFWNHQNAALGDPGVRAALTHAIDRRALMRLLHLPDEYRITDVPFTERQYWRGALPKPLAYDTARANRLLENAGWVRPTAASVRTRDGQPFTLTTLLMPGGAQEQAVVFIQAALRRIGIDMQIQPLELGALAGAVRQRDYDAFVLPYFNHVDGHLGYLGGDTTRGDGNMWTPPVPGYSNVEVTRLLLAIEATADTTVIDSLYGDLAPLILADLPVTFLLPLDETAVVRRHIRGLRSPFRGNPLQSMDALWIEDDR
jgi:peptide/nickel transport system substrate-binding protein